MSSFDILLFYNKYNFFTTDCQREKPVCIVNEKSLSAQPAPAGIAGVFRFFPEADPGFPQTVWFSLTQPVFPAYRPLRKSVPGIIILKENTGIYSP